MKRTTIALLSICALLLGPASVAGDEPPPAGELILVTERAGSSVQSAKIEDAGDCKTLGEPLRVVGHDGKARQVRACWTEGKRGVVPADLKRLPGVESARRTVSFEVPAEAPEYVDGHEPTTLADPSGSCPGGRGGNPYFSRSWHLSPPHDPMGLESAWEITCGGGIEVAVIDMAVDCSHDFIFCSRDVDHYDATRRRELPWDQMRPALDAVHGTHVAGIVMQVAPYAQILSIEACTRGGTCSDWDVAAGLRYAIDVGSDVINLSLGSSFPNELIELLVTEARDKGIVVVASVGNGGERGSARRRLYPAGFAAATGIGSTDPPVGERRSSFTQHASIFGMTPGREIISTCPGGGWCILSGTSMAAPGAAGIVALIRSFDRYLTPFEIEKALADTAVLFGGCGPVYDQSSCGHGRLRAGAALRSIMPDAPTRSAPEEETATPVLTSTPTPTYDLIGTLVATAETATAVHQKGTPTYTATPRPVETSTVRPESTASATLAPSPTKCSSNWECAGATATAEARQTGTAEAVGTAVRRTLVAPPPTKTLSMDEALATIRASDDMRPQAWFPAVLSYRPTPPPPPCEADPNPRACPKLTEDVQTAEARRTPTPIPTPRPTRVWPLNERGVPWR